MYPNFSNQEVDESLRDEANENWCIDKDAMLSVLRASAKEARARKLLPLSICRRYVCSGEN